MKKGCFSALAALMLSGCGNPNFLPASTMAGSPLSALGRLADVSSLLGQIVINGAANGLLAPNQPDALSLKIVDAHTGRAVTQFKVDDTKVMHLVIVSSDLSTFAHVHPYLDPKGSGSFSLALNQPTTDPDNQAVVHAIPKPGPYYLFADVTPTGQSTELVRFTANAQGSAPPTPLQLDPTLPNGSIQKYFTADSQPGQPGDPYRISLTIGRMTTGMAMMTLAVHVQALQGGQYTDVTDLQSWLGMPGHAIIVSQSGQGVNDKVFLHLHAGMTGPMMGGMGPMPKNTGPDLKFMAMGQEMPPPGVYKMWCQTERQGQILTFPFVFKI
jgi:hypothetical protein